MAGDQRVLQRGKVKPLGRSTVSMRSVRPLLQHVCFCRRMDAAGGAGPCRCHTGVRQKQQPVSSGTVLAPRDQEETAAMYTDVGRGKG